MTDERDSHANQGLLLTSVSHQDTDGAPHNRVFQSIFEVLRQRIRRGDWLPGTRLPSITKLAQEMEVSTGSVREALRSLQSIGMVRIEHGRGVFVTDSSSSLANNLSRHFQDMNIGLVIALAEARRILEPELAALAAERGTDSELELIEYLAKQMELKAHEQQDFSDPDLQFHRRIALAARNPILYQLIESVHDVLIESRKLTSKEPGMTERAVRYHLLIAEAIRDRNAAQARLLMLAHMNDALSGILASQIREQ